MIRAIFLTALTFAAAVATCLAQTEIKGEADSIWGDIYFDAGSSTLNDAAKKELASVYKWMQAHPGCMALLAGYDDQRTPTDKSVELGSARASTVKAHLASLGADGGSINTISFGNTKGMVQGSDETAWAKNRRVRYRIVAAGGPDKTGGMPAGVCQRCKK